MNIRETVTIRSPNGIDEECAKFTIDEVARPYVFRKTTKSNEKYTYSAWVMSEIESTLSIQGKEIPVTTNWKRQKIVFTANGSSLKIHFNKAGIYYIYKSQLETGDVATDWAPSPEDIEESLKATNARFELVVNKETLKTEINALADTFTFTGNGFVVNAENLTITEDGTIKALNGEFGGTITAKNGTIGGWTIGEYALTSGEIDSDTYTSLSGDGIEWIIGVSENFYNSFADRIENLPYQNRKFQFYSADKQYDSDKATVTPLGGFDAVGMFRGTSNINLEPGVDNYTEYIVGWNGNANLNTVDVSNILTSKKGIISQKYIAAGTRIYLPNGYGLKGMKNGYDFDPSTAFDESISIAYVSENDRVIVGNASNPYDTEIRSPGAIFMKCNGTTADDDNRYAIHFTRVNFGTTDSPEYYGCLRSRLDNYTVIGSANYRFRNVYSTNGVSTTSDRNLKRNINPISDKYIELFDLLKPVTYVLNEGERIHTGFISQDVEEAMNSIGMSSMEFGGFCKDIISDDEGVPILDEYGKEKNYYSLRYKEFIAINTAKIKQLERKVNELERMITKYGN